MSTGAVLDELRRLKSGVTIMQDLAGPKIRIGMMRPGTRAFT